MRVLLVAIDVYTTIGGGETVYRKLIEANPDVEFVYFRIHEPRRAQRPSNASSFALLQNRDLSVAQPFFPKVRLDNLETANAFSRSVAGQRTDRPCRSANSCTGDGCNRWPRPAGRGGWV